MPRAFVLGDGSSGGARLLRLSFAFTNRPMQLTAVVARGVEDVLVRELEGLGAQAIEPSRGAVRFEGDLELAYRACLHLRTASRVLMPIERFAFEGPDSLYEHVTAMPWQDHVSPDGTIAVDVVASAGLGVHTHYLELRTKDAICDRLRALSGRRPSVDTSRPDVRVHVHVGATEATLSIDLSGESMHRRGYRPRGAAAPVKETLAAALLLMARWDERAKAGESLVDPMCGSGTFPVEAALIAADVAPGLSRGHHGMLGWRGHDAAILARLWAEARERSRAGRSSLPSIAGFDASDDAVSAALASIHAAGFSGQIRIEKRALEAVAPLEGMRAGIVVANPPYGARLGTETELVPLYEKLGDVLRRRFPGYVGYVLTGSPVLAKHVGLRPAAKHPVWNGPIECRFLELPIADRPVTRDEGPAWRKPSAEAAMFENRLRKNAQKLERWAKREGLDCYRVYDADVPEFNVAVDRYGPRVVVQEYAAPRSVDPARAAQRIRDVLLVVPAVLGVPAESVVFKVRRRQTSGGQYERDTEAVERLDVHEGGHTFVVELGGHLDTGLFLDHRRLRAMAAEEARGRTFLNLFAYTCTASVYAAKAGALSTTSVDLSQTYLERGKENFRKNGLDPSRHRFLRDDCLAHLSHASGRYGVIFLNPPSYSRSHRMEDDFDVRRDHPALVREAMRLLEPDGTLYFATHARGFVLDATLAGELAVEDVSERSVPFDFERSPHRAFRIRRRIQE